MPPLSILTGPAVVAVVVVVAAGLLAGVGGRVALHRLPEPTPPPGADADLIAEYAAKPSYRSLATTPFVVITGLLAAAGTGLAVLTRPAAFWGCWLVLGAVGVLLAAVDARTTWLPTALTYTGWAAMAGALVVGLPLVPDPGRTALTVVGCAVVAGVGYLVLWLVTAGRGMAFGDVRLMPLIGAAAGTIGWSGLYWAVLLGSVCGALVGVVRLLLRRRGPFPYAPALVSGPYLAAGLLYLLG